MRYLITLLAALMLGSFSCASPAPKVARTTHRIEQQSFFSGGVCSATAIGKHTLLTASHCEEPSNKILIDDKDEATIVGIVRDDYDHTILYLNGVEFKETAKVATKVTGEEGDEIFMWGNPHGEFMLLRRGYVMGMSMKGLTPVIMLDMNVFHGDSGAGLFDAKGNLVGVLSFMRLFKEEGEEEHMQVAGAVPLAFTDAQLKKAYEF